MNWTHPICKECYNLRYPNREPVKVMDSPKEKCCDCGKITEDGIYFRENPNNLNFPKEEKND